MSREKSVHFVKKNLEWNYYFRLPTSPSNSYIEILVFLYHEDCPCSPLPHGKRKKARKKLISHSLQPPPPQNHGRGSYPASILSPSSSSLTQCLSMNVLLSTQLQGLALINPFLSSQTISALNKIGWGFGHSSCFEMGWTV